MTCNLAKRYIYIYISHAIIITYHDVVYNGLGTYICDICKTTLKWIQLLFSPNLKKNYNFCQRT